MRTCWLEESTLAGVQVAGGNRGGLRRNWGRTLEPGRGKQPAAMRECCRPHLSHLAIEGVPEAKPASRLWGARHFYPAEVQGEVGEHPNLLPFTKSTKRDWGPEDGGLWYHSQSPFHVKDGWPHHSLPLRHKEILTRGINLSPVNLFTGCPKPLAPASGACP